MAYFEPRTRLDDIPDGRTYYMLTNLIRDSGISRSTWRRIREAGLLQLAKDGSITGNRAKHAYSLWREQVFKRRQARIEAEKTK